jgi:hypothetical protein
MNVFTTVVRYWNSCQYRPGSSVREIPEIAGLRLVIDVNEPE